MQDPRHGASVMSVMEMGNIVARAEFESTSFAFEASVLTMTPSRLPDVTPHILACLSMRLVA